MLGSGIVSASVVAAVLDSGRQVRVWGATASWYVSAFTDAGASAAATPRAAVKGAEIVVLAPADEAESVAIESELRGGLAKTTVLTVREPADDGERPTAWLSQENVDHLDCVVFGSLTRMGTTSAVILVSGSPAVVDDHRSMLDSLGLAISVGEPPAGARPTEIALVGFWYDVNVAVLRALANIDPSVRPVLELELRAVLTQLPSVTRSVDNGDPVGEDAGLAFHAQALEVVNASRSRDGAGVSELELAAQEVGNFLTWEDPRSPLARIVQQLRWPVEACSKP